VLKVLWLSKDDDLLKLVKSRVARDSLKIKIVEKVDNKCSIIVVDEVDESIEVDQFDKVIILETQNVKSPTYNNNYLVFNKQMPIESLLYLFSNNFAPSEKLSKNKKVKLDESVSNLITTYSPKGGAGRTTTAINMAYSLAESRKNVLLVDFTQFSNISIELELAHSLSSLDPVSQYISEEKVDEKKLISLIQRNIVKFDDSSVKFDLLLGMTAINYDSVSTRNIGLLITEMKRLKYDYIVIDATATSNVLNLSLMSLSDLVLLIADTSLLSAWSIVRFYPVMQAMNIATKTRLLINKYSSNVQYNIKDLEQQLQLKVSNVIPKSHKFKKGLLVARKSKKYRRIYRELSE